MGKGLPLWASILLALICILLWAPFIIINKYMLFSYNRQEIREQM